MHSGGLAMGLSKYKFRELLQESFRKNQDLKFDISYVRGISNNKQITSTKANVDEAIIRKFYIVNPGEFVYNPRTTRMGDKVGLGFNNTETPLLFSFNNIAFFIKETAKATILPEYLYMYFNRPEFDRYAMINGWGSATELFSFEEMCDIEINLPPIDIQQKYVAVYNAMLANQQSYERGLEDLKLTCDAYIDKLKHKRTLVEIGDFIQQINNKNIDNQKYRFAGLSMDNYFIDSIADDTELDFTKYKIVEPNEYGAVLMKVGRDARLTIARNTSNERYLISPAYYTFRITGIMPEYFMACVNRPEFERRGWFSCDTSARGSLSWGEFMKLKIPNATDEEQSIISELYKVQVIRIGINEKLKTQIKDLCPILIKGSIEEASR